MVNLGMPLMNKGGSLDLSQKGVDELITLVKQLQNQVENNQRKLEATLSHAIEREMITQDSFDKMHNLLIEFGKKKGWLK